jgi:hypothetical protein
MYSILFSKVGYIYIYTHTHIYIYIYTHMYRDIYWYTYISTVDTKNSSHFFSKKPIHLIKYFKPGF